MPPTLVRRGPGIAVWSAEWPCECCGRARQALLSAHQGVHTENLTMPSRTSFLLTSIALAALALAACGKKPEEPAAAPDETAQVQADQDAALKAREDELARREQELALKEKEQQLNDREAALAKASAPKPAPKPSSSSSSKPASTAAAPAPKPAAPVAKNYTVPAGTSISVQLPAAISTKTAKVGDRISANLTNDLVIDGKTVAKAGALMQ